MRTSNNFVLVAIIAVELSGAREGENQLDLVLNFHYTLENTLQLRPFFLTDQVINSL